jgi:hypothetical protein
MKKTFILIALALAGAACQKEQIRPARTNQMTYRTTSPLKGTWQWMSVRYPGDSFYSPAPPNQYLHITDTEIIEWGTYTWDSDELTVTWPGPVTEVVEYVRVGNSLTLFFQDGAIWKLGKTS